MADLILDTTPEPVDYSGVATNVANVPEIPETPKPTALDVLKDQLELAKAHQAAANAEVTQAEAEIAALPLTFHSMTFEQVKAKVETWFHKL